MTAEDRSKNIRISFAVLAVFGWWLWRSYTAIPADQPNTREVRVGAICRDGTRSAATGRGACSWHGGVARWITLPVTNGIIHRTPVERALRVARDNLCIFPFVVPFIIGLRQLLSSKPDTTPKVSGTPKP